MKKMTWCLFPLLLLGLFSPQSSAQQESSQPPRIGVGFQFSFPAWGLSAKYNFNNQMTAQGVFGMVGDLNTYGARFLYHMQRREQSAVYGYGMVGAFTYTGISLSDDWEWNETTETILGYGLGLGVEYAFSGLPEIGWSLETGFCQVDFNEVDYNFRAFMIGVGAHYYF